MPLASGIEKWRGGGGAESAFKKKFADAKFSALKIPNFSQQQKSVTIGQDF
jgi:hypothetical protein